MGLLKRLAEETVDEAADIKRICLDLIPVHVESDMTLDGLPDLVLSRIVYHTQEVKQKLRLALTCRRLYNFISRDKAAWPAQVCIKVRCPQASERKTFDERDVDYGQVDRAVVLCEPLPATTLGQMARLVSVLNLPDVCPVPVALKIVKGGGGVEANGRLDVLLLLHVLPWIAQQERRDDNQLPFVAVDLHFTHANFALFSCLLAVLCIYPTPVSVGVELYRLEEDAPTPTPSCCPLSRCLKQRPQDTPHRANVHRLWLPDVMNAVYQLCQLVRAFTNATDVHIGRIGASFGREFGEVWQSFVQSRAQPNRVHSLRVGIAGRLVTTQLAAAISLMPAGKGDIDQSVRRLVDEHLQPRLLESIEALAEVVGVTLPSIEPGKKAYHRKVNPKTGMWQWRSLVKLHLRMKHHPAAGAEWLVDIQADYIG